MPIIIPYPRRVIQGTPPLTAREPDGYTASYHHYIIASRALRVAARIL